LTELKRTLTVIPENSVLLLTCSSKPDGRLKSTQLLQKCRLYPGIFLNSARKTEQLVQRVQQVAQELG
jgi:DNA polymerase-3 subunit delta